jgi:ADP-heptose:LPS heptosyltransferase
MKKIPGSFLVINPFGIGDVLYSTPLLRAVANAFPRSRIYYMCNRRTEPILRSHPLVQKAFIYQRSEFVKAEKTSLLLALKKYNSFISEIRREHIECCLDLSLGTPFSLFALLAGIPRRLGLDYKGRGRFLTAKVRIDGFNRKHVADYYLDVLSLLGIASPLHRGLEVAVNQVDRQWAQEYIGPRPAGIPVVGIIPCGGESFGKDAELKRWPADRFSGVIAELARYSGAKVLVFAGPQEEAQARSIIAGSGYGGNCVEVIGLPLEKALALVGECDCVIGNDTGLVHCAEALGKDVVLLFGIADENVYGPYNGEHAKVTLVKRDIACRPCYRNFKLAECKRARQCLTDINVEEIVSIVKGILTRKQFRWDA